VPQSSLPADEVALQRGREQLDGIAAALTAASRAVRRHETPRPLP
jgi:hypothetical protein